jgi:hypothetical protein
MVAECAEMCRARAHDCITHERQEVSDGISVEKGERARESEMDRERVRARASQSERAVTE